MGCMKLRTRFELTLSINYIGIVRIGFEFYFFYYYIIVVANIKLIYLPLDIGFSMYIYLSHNVKFSIIETISRIILIKLNVTIYIWEILNRYNILLIFFL